MFLTNLRICFSIIMLFRSLLIFLIILPKVLANINFNVVGESIRLVDDGQTTTTYVTTQVSNGFGFEIVPAVPGTVFISNGSVVGNVGDSDYYYILTCTILEGDFNTNPLTPGILISKQKCEIEVCVS